MSGDRRRTSPRIISHQTSCQTRYRYNHYLGARFLDSFQISPTTLFTIVAVGLTNLLLIRDFPDQIDSPEHETGRDAWNYKTASESANCFASPTLMEVTTSHPRTGAKGRQITHDDFLAQTGVNKHDLTELAIDCADMMGKSLIDRASVPTSIDSQATCSSK